MKNFKKGFSLTELIIVIGLVSIVLVAILNYGSTETKLQGKASEAIAIQRESEKLMNLIIDIIQESESFASIDPDISDGNYHSIGNIYFSGQDLIKYKIIEVNGTDVFYKIENTDSTINSAEYAKNISDIQIREIVDGSKIIGLGVIVKSKIKDKEVVVENAGFFKQERGLLDAIVSPIENIIEYVVGFSEVEEVEEILGELTYYTGDWDITTNEDGITVFYNNSKNELFLYPSETYDSGPTDYVFGSRVNVAMYQNKTNYWGLIFESYPSYKKGEVDKNNLGGYVFRTMHIGGEEDGTFSLESIKRLDRYQDTYLTIDSNDITGLAIDANWWEEQHLYEVTVENMSGNYKNVTVTIDGVTIIDQHTIVVGSKTTDPMIGFVAQWPTLEILYMYSN